MRPDTRLDYAVLQLNPTRTRCELHISAQGLTYKLAAGLLQPFVTHLSAAEEQLAAGGYSIRLEPPDPSSAVWFTKGTMERFVRFVSTPEVLERVSSIDMELIEIEKTICAQSGDALEDTENAEELLSKLSDSIKVTGGSTPNDLEKSAKESFEGAEVGKEETTKQQICRALETRRMMLLQELEVAIARAMAAGFNIDHIGDLVVFAETFGAKRLWKACSKFMVLCKTKQQSRIWQDSLRVSAAEVAQTEMAFSGSKVNHVGSREISDLQGRGLKQDDYRRASLPSEGRPYMGDIGFEKLTRRGSLDELTGDFLQVAARMRLSGMMEDANADWTNNRQAPIGGGNRPVSEEMQAGVVYQGGNGDFRDSESALKLARGYQNIAARQAQPQHHPMHNVHPLMHGAMHASLPASFGFPGIPPPGLSYPLYHGNPYVGHAYADMSGWQIPSHVPPPYWPHPMSNIIAAPAEQERRDGAFPASQKQESGNSLSDGSDFNQRLPPPMQESINELPNVNAFHGEPFASTQRPSNDEVEFDELHEELPVSTQRPANDLPIFNELNEELPASTERPAGDASTVNELNREPPASTERPDNNSSNVNHLHKDLSASTESSVCDLPVNKETQQVIGTQGELPVRDEQDDVNTNDSFHDGDGEPTAERARRLPIRSSSPSRRSASPLKKVQIGRSGSRRPGMVAFRSVNYVANNTQEQIEGENNDRDSSESWSEDNDDSKNDGELNEQPVRARVQDVIGLFESKMDSADAIGKPLRKESGRLQAKNSVLKRWTESTAIKQETSETEDSVIINRIRKGASLAFVNAATESSSNQLNTTEMKKEGANLVHEENTELFAIKEGTCPDRPAAEDFNNTWKSPSNFELEVTGNQQSDDGACGVVYREQSSEPAVVPVAEIGTELASSSRPMDYDTKASGTGMADDIHPGQEKTKADKFLNDGQEKESEELGANSKKVSDRDVKAKAMQEMLEKRKAASGNRVRPNPLAEAQLRAEKLRAYKAGLQKSKQEKDEEEKKRIEDLKSQRKERIAARSGPVGGSSAQSPATRQAPQTPLTVSKPSPTSISHKLSDSSPRSSINAAATSLSPNVLKSKAANKLPRTPTGTPKANENALSRSVPSLSELKKESPKAALAVRSSTGSQRLSQLKKNLKDVDPNSSPKANGHSEEKRRSLPLVAARKGIPPAKDSKNESSPAVKTTKGLTASGKHQKKTGNSPGSRKPKKPAVEAEAVETVSSSEQVEQVDISNGVAMEETLDLETRSDPDNQEFGADNPEANADNNCSSLQEVSANEGDNSYAQIRAPASTEREIIGSAENSPCLVEDDSTFELVISCEPLVTEDSKDKETSTVVLASHTESIACSEDEHAGTACEKNTEENYIAHVSPRDDNLATCEQLGASRDDLGASRDDLSVLTDQLPTSPGEQYNPPRALPSDSPLHAPKNLPRLHEAIQQAHSPEFVPGVSRTSKTQVGEPASQKASKDHAKGFKRLLLLGRKGSRSSPQNATDGVSVPIVSEANYDGEDISSSNTAKVPSVSAPSNTDTVTHRADKHRVDSTSGTSSNKGSRSFFSLSTFRGKGEGKL